MGKRKLSISLVRSLSCSAYSVLGAPQEDHPSSASPLPYPRIQRRPSVCEPSRGPPDGVCPHALRFPDVGWINATKLF